ncbi:PAS domain S-box protein [Methylobacter sp. S3L5C]|uniref:PAS domain S-box protein n=1 Tax=Methylobacter sp. S3L5C TaxID=2839024 RepID=UPI001FACEDFE|nr:PAS domain S-box protein [Methylobacter sp. S3L5C]UOA09440.1 PAS domain S-box protein [Methylobacter sp. S3L5C]
MSKTTINSNYVQNKFFLNDTYKSITAFAVVLLLVALVVIAAFWSLRQSHEKFQAQRSTYALIMHMDALFSELKDAENGQRGYLLVDDELFLEPYFAVLDKISTHLEELHQFTFVGANQKHLETLIPLVNAKMTEMARVIELKRHHDMAGVLAAVHSGYGKQLMDLIRREINSITRLENNVLVQHIAGFQLSMRYMFYIICAASLLLLLFLITFAGIAYHYLNKVQENALSRLQKIASQLPGMVFQFVLRADGSSCFPFVSEAIRDIYRLSPEDVREDAAKVFAILHPDDYDDINASIQKSAQDLRPWHCEYRVKFDDGMVRWLLGDALLQREADGSTLWHGFITDITERKQMEAEHDEVLNSLQKIASQLPGMIFQFHLRTDGSSCFSFISDGIRNIYRLNPEEVRDDASKLFALHHPDDLDGIVAVIQKSAQELSPFSHEYRIKHDDGEVRWLLGNSLPQRELDGSTLWYGFTTDITERKLLEEKLHINSELLSSIIDSTPSSIFAFDLQGRFISVNKAVSEFYGKRKEDVLGKTLHEVFPKKIADNKMTTNNQVLVTGKRLDFEEQILNNDESLPRTLMVTKFPVQSASGEIFGVGGVATDISELKLAQETIQATAQYARSLLEANLDPMVTISSKGKISDVNRATERLTGLDRKQLVGSDFANYFTNPKQAREGYQLAFSNGFVTDYPLAMLHVSGKVTDVLYNASVYRDDKGNVLGVFAAARDITECKRIEHALRESEFFWKFAIEGTGDGVWDRNFLTSEMHYSKRWKEMLGYAENDILPTRQEWLDRIHPDDQLHVKKAMQAYLNGEAKSYSTEYRLSCKDNSYKWILDRGVVVNYAEDGTPLRMIGTYTDISKRKFQEQKDQEHLNQLAHVTRLGLLGEMASGIAHEVNQPLTAIASYTQVSLNLMKAEYPDLVKLAEVIYKTQQQALRAGQIIRRMREFVKSNTKQSSLVDLNELIQDAASLCLPELRLNNIVLTYQLQNSLPFINADKIQIEQVIINLIRNSADALDGCPENQQKKITIDSLLKLNDGIEVRIKDNGPGIPEDQQQKILMPFYTTKVEGMGMGLSICNSIIEAHEGYLKFNSKVGKGTTFYFTLPIKTERV